MIMRIEEVVEGVWEAPEAEAERRAEADQTALFLLIAGAVMLFVTFTAAYLVRRESADWVRVALPSTVWWSAGVVAASSVTMELARRAAGAARGWVLATLALGLLFVGVQVVAWRQLVAQGAYATTSPHAGFYFVLTGAHAVHVAAGLVVLVRALARAGRAPLGLCATWWHFVGAAWIWVAAVLTVF